MDILLLAIVTYLVIITIGYAIHKYLRIPWMFTVVVFGMILSALGLFKDVMGGANFQLLSKMGMLFFLFTIGIDLELEEIRKLGGYIVAGEILLTLTEGTLIAFLLYFGFSQFVSHSFIVAMLCGVAFGTVGEVVLLAILKEFGLEKTRFGQLAMGIGVADDIWEILVLAAIIALPAFTSGVSQNAKWQQLFPIIISLFGVLIATFFLSWAGRYTRHYLEKVQKD
jgi:Kef-type K+ transport system membrane component KefB